MKRRWAVSSLGAAASLALFLSGGAPFALPLLCLVAILVEVALLRPRGLLPRPPVLIGLEVVLLTSFGYLALLRDPPVDFLTLLLVAAAPFVVLRLLHPATDFNDFLVVIVSLLLVVGSAALAKGPIPVAITALYVLVGCHSLAALAAQPEVPGRMRFRMERPVGWWAAAPAVAAHHLGLGGLLVGALFYLVAPRPDLVVPTEPGPMPLFGRGSPAGESRSTSSLADFPREVVLGDIGRIKRGKFLALQVDIRAHGRPYDPRDEERSMLLLRARAWERYSPDRARWEPSAGRVLNRKLPEDGLLEPGPSVLDWSFEVLGYDGKTLFLPPRARRIRAAGGRLVRDWLGVVTSSVPVFQYTVSSAWPVREEELAALMPDQSERNLLVVDEAIARVLGPHVPSARKGDVAAAAGAVRAFFASNGFRYTLDLPPALTDSKDPLRLFLEGREGNCELYATTSCLFLRMLGVPARVAGGLRCAERIGPGRYQARFSNAHAWVEVPCREVGFVALDFTPGDSTAVAATGSTPVGAAGEEAGGRGGEEESVLDWRDPFAYGPEDQERVVGWITDRLKSWPVLGLVGLCILLLVGPPVAAAVKRRPKSPLRVTAPAGGRRSTLAFYARWLKACAAKGHVRSRVQTPREFLDELPPELRETGVGITAEFERLRYGA